MEIVYQDDQIAVIVKPVGMESEREIPDALQSQRGAYFYRSTGWIRMWQGLWSMPEQQPPRQSFPGRSSPAAL